MSTERPAAGVPEHAARLRTVVREWGRIGCVGFGGPPAHIALLRKLCVTDREWLNADEFEAAIAACNLLPGPSSTQLAIFCAWRVRGRLGALAGGAAFIVPGLIVILALSFLFLAGNPPAWVVGAAAGAGSAVAAVAAQTAWSLVPPSWKRASANGAAARWRRARWLLYLLAGGVASAAIGPWLVLALLGCGLAELAVRQLSPGEGNLPARQGPPGEPPDHDARRPGEPPSVRRGRAAPAVLAAPVLMRSFPLAKAGLLGKAAAGATVGAAVFAAIAWVAFKVGALSFGGGFVIIPLMQADAVGRHWMTNAQFLNAVAFGQLTPGPVVQTVAVVGYAAAGLPGGLLASAVAFAPSFIFILGGARYFNAIRSNEKPQAFLDGAGPAAIGAIFGAGYLLASILSQPWQFAVLAAAALLLFVVRRGVVFTLICSAVAGLIIVVAGVAP